MTTKITINRAVAVQALQALWPATNPNIHAIVSALTVALEEADRTALAEQQSAKHGEPVRTEFTRVINHAIEQGTEAWVFLRCWQQGDWSGCAEFGFEPNMAAYTAPQPTKPADLSLKRYEPEIWREDRIRMGLDEVGDWVKYEDVLKLIEAITALRERLGENT